jgi:hypothetical protein
MLSAANTIIAAANTKFTAGSQGIDLAESLLLPSINITSGFCLMVSRCSLAQLFQFGAR